MSYNGWKNWETWNVNLWLDDSGICEECVQDAGNVWDGADAIREYVESLQDDFMGDVWGMFTDLINAALRDVDWREIAEHHKPEEWGDANEAPEEEEEEE